MSDEKNHTIMKVSEVREEYAYIQEQACDKCGLKAMYKLEIQRLVESRGFPCDELDCVCKECGAKKTFVFDVSKIFEEYANIFELKE
jgi:hypothetical protein